MKNFYLEVRDIEKVEKLHAEDWDDAMIEILAQDRVKANDVLAYCDESAVGYAPNDKSKQMLFYDRCDKVMTLRQGALVDGKYDPEYDEWWFSDGPPQDGFNVSNAPRRIKRVL